MFRIIQESKQIKNTENTQIKYNPETNKQQTFGQEEMGLF